MTGNGLLFRRITVTRQLFGDKPGGGDEIFIWAEQFSTQK